MSTNSNSQSNANQSLQFETIKYEVQNLVGIITINRPTKLNSLNRQVLQELKSLLKTLIHQEGFPIRGIILTGEGEKAFIAGADIAEMSSMNRDEAYDFALLGQMVTLLFEKQKVPVIAAVNGFALGGGLEMALSADFIFCTKNAVFGLPEVKLGLIPGFGGTQRLQRIIGRHKAREVIYTGRNINSEEAFNLGLSLKVFESKEEMINASLKKIEEMQKNSPVGIYSAKKVMNLGSDSPLTEALNLELEQFTQIFNSEDMREGTKAFLEKRAAQFQGK